MKSTESAARESRTRVSVTAITERPSAQVVIVGGGINGIATFRDLALQGVEVILVERGDFVSGASAASSHMVHGGVRYLENGEFRLVNEAVHERNGLIKIAPHYVKPLETTIPIFSTFSGIVSAPSRFLTHKAGKPKERGAALIKIGLLIYDSFSRDGGTVPKHRFHGRAKSLRDLPRMNKNLKYTATYFDAAMEDPERLALDVLHDGIAVGANARAVNYVEAVGSSPEGIRLRDRQTGEEFTVQADVVVNTSGPWTDLTNEAFGVGTQYMGGTKGSHVVLDNPELFAATKGREIFFENDDGRIVLIYPLKGKVMVGTTDIDADPSVVPVATDEEVEYFFDLVKHVYPDIHVGREQIVYRFSGIRPLPRHDDEVPGFVSRDYRIEKGTLGSSTLFSLVGGKWTTFRALAEHLSNDVLGVLGKSRTISTDGLPIGGGRDFPRSESARRAWIGAHADGVSSERAAQLLTRYGTRAAALIEYLAEAGDTALESAPGYSRQEIAYLVRTELVVRLLDIVKRRTSLAFVGALTRPLLEELAQVAAAELGWDDERTRLEIDETVDILSEQHGLDLAATGSAVGA